MPDINDLRQQRAAVNTQAQALAALEAAGTDLSAEQVAEFAAHHAKFNALDEQITRMEKAERMNATAAIPVSELGNKQKVQYATPKQPEEKGAKVAHMIQAIGVVGRGGREAAHYAETVLGDSEVAMALNSSAATAGGVLVPQGFMAEVIELLTPKSVVRRMGAISLPMPNGNLTIPKMTGGATSYYVSESMEGTASQQTFGDLELRAKNMITLVPVSNQLLSYAGVSPSIDKTIMGDMINSMGLREDLAFIRGDGTNNTPTGFRTICPAANIVVASDGATVQKVQTDLAKLELKLLNANVRMTSPGWVMNPNTFTFLSSLLNTNGIKVYPEMDNMMLRGKPVAMTTQVPNNLNTNQSEIYLVDFADAVIGDSGTVTLAISAEASYTDPASGKMVSTYTSNQTLIRAVSSSDFGMRHDASVAVLTGVTWGN